MPLEITLNAVRRNYFLAKSRHSIFLIEETEPYTGHKIVGCCAGYARWIVEQKCSAPILGEPLMILSTDPNNDTVITTKIRELRRV